MFAETIVTFMTSHMVVDTSLDFLHKEFFDQRISPVVVTISDEEGEIDMLVKTGM